MISFAKGSANADVIQQVVLNDLSTADLQVAEDGV
jgi:hypothetical protein